MKYTKTIKPSDRVSIFHALDPEHLAADPHVGDEDLPEPTGESDAESDHEDQLTPEQQEIIENIDRDHVKADLQARYEKIIPSFSNLEDIENFVVLGQIPRGTPVEPEADPGEPEAIENTWTHKTLQKVLSAENALTTDSGDASKASDDSKLASYKYNSRFMQDNFYQKYYLFNTEIATYEQRLNLKK